MITTRKSYRCCQAVDFLFQTVDATTHFIESMVKDHLPNHK